MRPPPAFSSVHNILLRHLYKSRKLLEFQPGCHRLSPNHIPSPVLVLLASASAMRFCAPVDPAPRLAVLGVLSTDGHRDYREAIRSSWMRKANAADITTRFVMRGLGSAAEDEAHSHGDIVFVEALASMVRKNGPLQSLVLWWQCAVESWPQASLIGKADDDIWVNPTPTLT